MLDGVGQAVLYVVFQYHLGRAVERGAHGGQLDEHFGAVAAGLHHLFHRLQVADGAGEADVRFPGEEKQDVSTVMTKKGLRLTFVKDRDAMTEYLLRILRPEDVLLLKASNGMKLSEVAKAVIEE